MITDAVSADGKETSKFFSALVGDPTKELFRNQFLNSRNKIIEGKFTPSLFYLIAEVYMLVIDTPIREYYNEDTYQFITIPGRRLHFEHSLKTVAEWETFISQAFFNSRGKDHC